MISPKLAIILVLALVHLIFICESEGSFYPSGLHADSAEITVLASQKVNLSVYYESLSAPCATFIIKNLGEIFNNDLIDIINLQLVPWANSSVNKANNSIICQNGPDECEINSVAACALNVFNDVNKQYGLINCLEFLAIDGNYKDWRILCLKRLSLATTRMLNCINNGDGTQLGRKYINETAHLQPPRTFLPWVVVNNKSIGKDYASFTRYVCEAYKGTPVPAACKK